MDIGMLWFDDSRKPLTEKVARAVEHYKTKYGAVPTVCYVNPDTLNGGAAEAAAGVQLRTARNVLVHHFWIGVGDTATENGHKPAGRAGASGRGAGSTARPGQNGSRRRANA